MRSIKTFILFAIACICMSGLNPGRYTYVVAKNHDVTINGTSNLHSWKETVENVSGSGVINWNNDENFDVETLSIKMEVHSIKSDMGSVMNNNTYKALKADAYPEIIFELAAPAMSVQSRAGGVVVPVKGRLSIAGVTRPVDMKVTISMQNQKLLTVEGSETIRMTDYGIEPPTALFGTLKTGNEITIHFKAILE